MVMQVGCGLVPGRVWRAACWRAATLSVRACAGCRGPGLGAGVGQEVADRVLTREPSSAQRNAD